MSVAKLQASLDRPRESSPAADRAKQEEAARAFEAHFLKQMLDQMMPPSAAGTGSSTYQGMMHEQLAGVMAENSPLGIKDMLLDRLASDPSVNNGVLTQANQPLENHPAFADLHQRDLSDGRISSAARNAKLFGELTRASRISSSYGRREHPLTHRTAFHHGIDLAAPTGSSVRAALSGTVVRSEFVQGYGQLVELSHEDGTHTRYAHLSSRAVQAGSWVKKGQALGEVGESGSASGPHLHFEIRKDGHSIDPRTWMKDRELTTFDSPSTGIPEAQGPNKPSGERL